MRLDCKSRRTDYEFSIRTYSALHCQLERTYSMSSKFPRSVGFAIRQINKLMTNLETLAFCIINPLFLLSRGASCSLFTDIDRAYGISARATTVFICAMRECAVLISRPSIRHVIT